MPTLAELWRSVFPAARPYSLSDALDRPVAWVRVLKARVPAFDALEADDLVILPEDALRTLAASGVEAQGVVEAILRAAGTGVLVVADPAADDRARTEEVLQQSARLGLGALLLAGGDISALERSAIAFVVNAQAELQRRAGVLEAELEQAALSGSGAEGLAATIARFLSRAVAIEAADGTLVAVHAPADLAEAAAHLGEYLQRRRAVALRTPLPAGGASAGAPRASAGSLVLLGSAPPTELERVAAARVAALLALELGHGEHAGRSPARAGEGLPADGPPWVVLVARQIDEDNPTTLEERERTRRELRRSEPVKRLTIRGDALSLELRFVAAAGAEDARGVEVAGRLAERLARPVAVSRPFQRPIDRAPAEAQARATLEALEALPAAERERLGAARTFVARSELMPAYRMLAVLPALPDGARQARLLLAPLLTGRPQRDRERLATLRAVLDHPGLAEAAAALGIHRNTLAYRISRIEQLCGWRLSDPDLRFSLSLATRLVQDAQEPPAEIGTSVRRLAREPG